MILHQIGANNQKLRTQTHTTVVPVNGKGKETSASTKQRERGKGQSGRRRERTNPGDGLGEDGESEAVVRVHGELGMDEEEKGLLDGVEAGDGAALRHLGLRLHVHVHAEEHVLAVEPTWRQRIPRRSNRCGGVWRYCGSRRPALHKHRPQPSVHARSPSWVLRWNQQREGKGPCPNTGPIRIRIRIRFRFRA